MLTLFCFFALYGLAAASLHLLHGLSVSDHKDRATQYVLVTKNNALQIECVLRLIQLFHWFKGESIRVAISDEGSTDETLEIVNRLAPQLHANVLSFSSEAELEQVLETAEKEDAVVIRLSNEEDLNKIPLFQS